MFEVFAHERRDFLVPVLFEQVEDVQSSAPDSSLRQAIEFHSNFCTRRKFPQ